MLITVAYVVSSQKKHAYALLRHGFEPEPTATLPVAIEGSNKNRVRSKCKLLFLRRYYNNKRES